MDHAVAAVSTPGNLWHYRLLGKPSMASRWEMAQSIRRKKTGERARDGSAKAFQKPPREISSAGEKQLSSQHGAATNWGLTWMGLEMSAREFP